MYRNHRNSQKRFYVPGVCYFVTVVTRHRYPYFEEPIFCQTFVENLRVCKRLKRFQLYGWFLGYDHCHLLLRPGDEANYSEIMHFLKRNISRDANKIMLANPNEGDVPQRRKYYDLIGADMDPRLHEWKIEFATKYPHHPPFPLFRWQKSFHDHYIRGWDDFIKHLGYIAGNPAKHEMPLDWQFVFTNPDYHDFIDEF